MERQKNDSKINTFFSKQIRAEIIAASQHTLQGLLKKFLFVNVENFIAVQRKVEHTFLNFNFFKR